MNVKLAHCACALDMSNDGICRVLENIGWLTFKLCNGKTKSRTKTLPPKEHTRRPCAIRGNSISIRKPMPWPVAVTQGSVSYYLVVEILVTLGASASMFLFLAIFEHVFDRCVKTLNELVMQFVSEFHLCVCV